MPLSLLYPSIEQKNGRCFGKGLIKHTLCLQTTSIDNNGQSAGLFSRFPCSNRDAMRILEPDRKAGSLTTLTWCFFKRFPAWKNLFYQSKKQHDPGRGHPHWIGLFVPSNRHLPIPDKHPCGLYTPTSCPEYQGKTGDFSSGYSHSGKCGWNLCVHEETPFRPLCQNV